MNQNNIDTLLKFLNMPLNTADEIFEQFAALPNATYGFGKNNLERYVYIPGSRKDRVVLVAHADTAWDKNYTNIDTSCHKTVFEDGIFKSSNPQFGIGADDRAGCAILWLLKNSGHSILLTDGEEKGKIGANFLKNSNPSLFKELNRHQFMIEFDWSGTNSCLYNQVDNTKKFKNYIATNLKFEDAKTKGGTDLGILCHKICGVNLGVGYYNCHKANETLALSDWENTLNAVTEFLKSPQPKFRTKLITPYIRAVKISIYKLLQILKIK